MVDALRTIHRSLRAGGVLLDLHPQPEPVAVEVWREGRREPVGHVVDDQDISDITEAEIRLDLVERDGWFTTETRRVFDLAAHFPGVDEWFEYRSDHDCSSVVPKELENRARRLLGKHEGELVIREPIRASLLKRLPRPG